MRDDKHAHAVGDRAHLGTQPLDLRAVEIDLFGPDRAHGFRAAGGELVLQRGQFGRLALEGQFDAAQPLPGLRPVEARHRVAQLGQGGFRRGDPRVEIGAQRRDRSLGLARRIERSEAILHTRKPGLELCLQLGDPRLGRILAGREPGRDRRHARGQRGGDLRTGPETESGTRQQQHQPGQRLGRERAAMLLLGIFLMRLRVARRGCVFDNLRPFDLGGLRIRLDPLGIHRVRPGHLDLAGGLRRLVRIDLGFHGLRGRRLACAHRFFGFAGLRGVARRVGRIGCRRFRGDRIGDRFFEGVRGFGQGCFGFGRGLVAGTCPVVLACRHESLPRRRPLRLVRY